MKQVIALALMTALCLTLGACAGRPADADLAQEIRIEYLAASALSMTAEISADYGEVLFACTLRYDCQGSGGTLTVLAPDTIAGLTADVSDGGTTLSYDGASWDAGRLSEDGLTPAAALPLALSQWQDGFISDCASENLDGTAAIAITTDISDAVKLKTWFDTATHLPIRSEFSLEGNMVLSLVFRDVSLA